MSSIFEDKAEVNVADNKISLFHLQADNCGEIEAFVAVGVVPEVHHGSFGVKLIGTGDGIYVQLKL